MTNEFNFVRNAMCGLSMIGQALNFRTEEDVQVAMLILRGEVDMYLNCAVFSCNDESYLKDNVRPTSEKECATGVVILHVAKIKETIQALIQEVIRAGVQQDKMALIVKLRESTKPHSLGTVAEISKKYGISKTVVRRHKAAGTLDDFINNLSSGRGQP